MIRDPKAFERLVNATRAFVRDVVIRNENRVEAEDKVPLEVVQAMRELGSFG